MTINSLSFNREKSINIQINKSLKYKKIEEPYWNLLLENDLQSYKKSYKNKYEKYQRHLASGLIQLATNYKIHNNKR